MYLLTNCKHELSWTNDDGVMFRIHWHEFFFDDNVAVPIVDRIIHHSKIFMSGAFSRTNTRPAAVAEQQAGLLGFSSSCLMSGESYRLRQKSGNQGGQFYCPIVGQNYCPLTPVSMRNVSCFRTNSRGPREEQSASMNILSAATLASYTAGGSTPKRLPG